MNGARMQVLVNKGYAKAASRVGLPHQWYRPTGPLDPVAPGTLQGTLPASFDANNYLYTRPNLYGKATWTALVDASKTAVGDYLVGPTGSVWFMVAQQPLLPLVAISCNATLTLMRPFSSDAVGAIGYNGDNAGDEILIARGWPASMLTKGRGDKGDVQLPGDVRTPWVEVLLPAIPGATIQFADVLLAGDQRMKVSSSELSDLGWRLLCLVAVA